MVKNSKNNREKRQGDLLELQLSEQKERIVEINEMYGEILQIRHDIRKCIGCACVLMQQGNYNEASEYLEKLRDEKIGTVTEYVFLENQALNAIMNSRLTICEKENIDMRVSMFDCVGSFSEMDITILIANMLDNAIESCRKVEDARKIIFSVEKNKEYTSFSLINTAPESESENKKLRTTKGDTKNHGYGIKTMKEIAEKYDGMYNFHYEKNNFYTDIWLKEPSGES